MISNCRKAQIKLFARRTLIVSIIINFLNILSLGFTKSIVAQVPLTCNIGFSGNESCPEKNDGFIIVSASGGTRPYTFILGFRTNTTGVFGNLPAGDHEIIVQDFLNQQVSCGIITINSPDPITVDMVEVMNETCFENDDGSIQFNATGGTPPYTYDNGFQTNSTGLFGSV